MAAFQKAQADTTARPYKLITGRNCTTGDHAQMVLTVGASNLHLFFIFNP